jgi:hypothetical protein
MPLFNRPAGCLHNLSELARRRSNRSARSSAASPRFAADPNNAFASSLERKGSIERSMDLGAMTASTVLGLYLDGQQEGNELIMLSELQVSSPCTLPRLQEWGVRTGATKQWCSELAVLSAARAALHSVCVGQSDAGVLLWLAVCPAVLAT